MASTQAGMEDHIERGGYDERRVHSDRRVYSYKGYYPERRAVNDRRSGVDRRSDRVEGPISEERLILQTNRPEMDESERHG